MKKKQYLCIIKHKKHTNMLLTTLEKQEKALFAISAKANKMADEYAKKLRIKDVKNASNYSEYLTKNYLRDDYFESLMAIVGNAECAIENNSL